MEAAVSTMVALVFQREEVEHLLVPVASVVL